MVSKLRTVSFVVLLVLIGFLTLQTMWSLQETALSTVSSLYTLSNQDDVFFTNTRIRWWKQKKCVSVWKSGENTEGFVLVSDFCNPNVKQSFTFLKSGLLIFEQVPDKCVKLNLEGSNGTLTLGSCETALKFYVNKNQQLQHSEIPLCISSLDSSSHAITGAPKTGDPVVLRKCEDDTPSKSTRNLDDYVEEDYIVEATRLEFIHNEVFLADRKALIIPPDIDICSLPCDVKQNPACFFNSRPEPALLLPPHAITKCPNISSCVTLVTKTAKRPSLVVRLAESVRKILGYDLNIIAIDDGPDNYPEEIWESIRSFKNMNYIVSEHPDLGISAGRNRAVGLVTTPYFLLVDDDNIFIENTDIQKMVDILDTTDVSLVGGHFFRYQDFSGFFEIEIWEGSNNIYLHKGACVKTNQTIPNFPDCFMCDITPNVFLARTRDILDVGGWSPELLIQEHKDLFLKLKAARKKVLSCPKIEVKNARGASKKDVPGVNHGNYNTLRRDKARRATMTRIMCNLWNVDKIGERGSKDFTLMPAVDSSNSNGRFCNRIT